MFLHDFLVQNLSQISMISLTHEDKKPIQYNYWNYEYHKERKFFLLKDDFSIGHILSSLATINLNEDGSYEYKNEFHPKNLVLNFYFGGSI